MALSRAAGFPVVAAASGQSTVNIPAGNIGDLVAIAVRVNSTVITSVGMSGGSVPDIGAAGGWQKAIDFTHNFDTRYIAIWFGTRSSAAASTATVAWSAANTLSTALVADSVTGAPAGSIWTLDGTPAENDNGNTVASETAAPLFASLTPTEAGVHLGVASCFKSSFTAGPGGSWLWTNATTKDGEALLLNTVAGTAYQPGATLAAADGWETVAALFYPGAAPAPSSAFYEAKGGVWVACSPMKEAKGGAWV